MLYKPKKIETKVLLKSTCVLSHIKIGVSCNSLLHIVLEKEN